MFIDEAEIFVRGGKGGNGCVSFRREKYIPKGGPDGGNGGDGGNVVFMASEEVTTLLDFTGRHHWLADNGRPGEGRQSAGKAGSDLLVKVPTGTLVYDRDTGLLLKDLCASNERVVIAAGGKGGLGNRAFATPTHQTPREAEPGFPGEERWLRLELKLIADVGIVGMPNAGKSTLLSRLSKARPKIADYPFTTLTPQLGIVELSGFRRFVMADIPGLIEGAHEGVGLGDRFLRHIERTRLLLHLIDINPLPEQPSPAEAYRVIRNELTKYSRVLAEKREVVVANKIDLFSDKAAVTELEEAIGCPAIPISAAAGMGLAELVERLWGMIKEEASAAVASPGQ
jgi:GTP-binding protein